jgi:hypothetical protein
MEDVQQELNERIEMLACHMSQELEYFKLRRTCAAYKSGQKEMLQFFNSLVEKISSRMLRGC